MPILDNIIQEQKSIKSALKLLSYTGGQIQDPDGNNVTPVGTQGNAAGFRYTIDLSATTAADPGQGKIRFNNATLASVTAIYIDNTDTAGTDMSAFLDAMTNSQLVIKANDNLDSSFAVFDITTVTNSTGYRTLAVTHVASVAFSAAEAVVIQLAKKGTAGAAGANAYLYVGYASDGIGTDFTTTFNPVLNYIAFKNTTTAITPVASDFDGLWKNYRGTDGTNGTNGTNGASSYSYIAYAADNIGTGFTTTFDSALNFVAFRTTTSPLSPPVAGDFTGLWKNYKGADGTNGTDGAPGIGRNYTYKSSTGAANPGPGAFRLNQATVNAVTHIYINPTAANSIDISGELGTWQVNGRIHVRSRSTTDGSYAIYEIDVVTNQTTYYDFTVTYLAGNTTLNFTADELCTVAYIGMDLAGGTVTEAAVLAAGDFVRFDTQSGVIVSMLDGAGNPVYGVNPKYTWAAIPDPTTLPADTCVVLDKASLGGTHKAKATIYLTNGDGGAGALWYPAGGSQLSHNGVGSVASPLAQITGTTATKFALAASPSFPANFWKVGMGVRVRAMFRKSDADTNASTFTVRFGASDSTSADIIASEGTTSAHTGREVVIDTKCYFSAIGAATTAKLLVSSSTVNTGGETGSFFDRFVNIATTGVTYIVFTATCSASGTATHDLIAYEIWIEGA